VPWNWKSLIESAAGRNASDLHLEAGMPPALRVRGSLLIEGEPVPAPTLLNAARQLVGELQWPVFLERRSYDLSRTIRGVRCRINVYRPHAAWGWPSGCSAPFKPPWKSLNLHPDFKKLVKNTHGLILVSGPTGSGKSSTLAALIQEINLTEAAAHRHRGKPGGIHISPAPVLHSATRSRPRHAEF